MSTKSGPIVVKIDLKRLEDLGRISEMLNALLENPAIGITCEYSDADHFAENYTDLELLFCQLECLKNDIYDILAIAKWGDTNEE